MTRRSNGWGEVKRFREMFYRDIKREIAGEAKQMVLGVGGDPEHPVFCYTIGNHQRGLPELLMVGLIDHRLLNVAARCQRERGEAFGDGEVVRFGDANFPVKFIDGGTIARKHYTIQVGQYYGTEDYQVRQLLIPDKQGRFPGDPDCAEPYASEQQLEASQ